MTRIIIDDVESIQDLYDALAAVARVFIDPRMFASVEERFSKGGGENCDSDEYGPIAAVAAPLPYIPCPDRGAHLRLTDCWACWCDVHRGACIEVDVLAPEAWDIAAAELLAASRPRRRADVPVVTEETVCVGGHRAEVVEGEGEVVEGEGEVVEGEGEGEVVEVEGEGEREREVVEGEVVDHGDGAR